MSALITIFCISSLITMISNESLPDLAVLKMKTYNSTTPMDINSTLKTFLLPNIYLELEVDNENDSKKGVKQILNTFIDGTINLLSMRQLNLSNFCKYNSSLSNTFKVLESRAFYCKAEEKIKIYNDLDLSKYKYTSLAFDNSDCLKDSLCGNAGIDILSHLNKDIGFIYQLHSTLNINEQNWAFLFSSKDEGKFIFGDLPHKYIPNEYEEKNLITFNSASTNYEIALDSIKFEEKGKIINDFGVDNINVQISPNIEGMIFGHVYFASITKYFNDYIEKEICTSEVIDLTTMIYCDGEKFGIKDIESFPKIVFNKYDFNVTFENKELFHYRDSKYIFNIYKRNGQSKKFTFGRIFLKKYLTIFNADKKTIYFYKNKQISQINNNNESEANKSFIEEWWIIILIVFIVCLILFLILGILIGRILYKNRNMHKNELDDNYEYQADNKNDALNDNDKGIN